MERFFGAISLTVLLLGLTAVAQVQPSPPLISSKVLLPNNADAPLSRADLAKLLVKTLGLHPLPQTLPQTVTLPDVSKSHWAHAEIQTVVSLGLMTTRQGQFLPNQPVPRAEALAILAKAKGLEPLPEKAVTEILSRYPDGKEVPTGARGAIATSLQTGLLSPKAGKIAPLSPITRGDMVHALGILSGRTELIRGRV
jgi:S-layer homology domain